MSNKNIFTLSFILVAFGVCIAIVSFNKDTEIEISQQDNAKLSTCPVDFSSYYKTSKEFSYTFWSACDRAYNSNRAAFLSACDNNDFETFKEITGLDSIFFDYFKTELITTMQNIEEDHPGISEQYNESPCEDCNQNALLKVGRVVSNYGGNSAVEIYKLEPRDCFFICSMACMSILEAYVPCVLACTELCINLNRFHN